MPTAQAAQSRSRSSSLFLCAWCECSIGRTAAIGGAPKNFGICPDCLETQLAVLGRRKPARSVPKHVEAEPDGALRAAR